MKKSRHIFYSIAILMLILWAGCSDLEQEPIGLLTPNTAFSSVGDVEKGVFGSYYCFANENFWGRKYSLSIMLRGDMVDIGERNTAPRRMEINDFEMQADNGMVAVFWPIAYQAISAANTAIFGGENLDAEPEEVNPLIAEAKFNKAFTYYHLVRCFGGLPYINEFIQDPASVATLEKTPEEEVYEYIIADLLWAKEWLPWTQENNIRTRATKGSAAAYLASAYLDLGRFDEAYTEAKWVIDNRDQLNYNLVPDFQDLFDGPNADGLAEHIFAIDFKSDYGGEPNNVDWIPALTGPRNATPNAWSIAVPAQLVYDTWDDRDYRKKVSFVTTAVYGEDTVSYDQFETVQRPHIGKYYLTGGGTTVPGDTDHNYADMRYADVLLMAAEALNEISGPTAEAIGYVNQVRARARNWNGTMTDFPEDVAAGIGKEDFLKLVLEERRLELAFEFKRWWDIKRRRLGDEVFKGPGSLEPHENFNAGKDYLMPLPQSELDNYPSFGPQNPGY